MRSLLGPAVLVALVTSAYSGATDSPASSTDQSASASQPATESAATASTAATGQLIGRWATGQTTCAEQNAAVEAGGFTAEEMTLGRWSPTCAAGMPHGSQFTILFTSFRLVIFEDGEEEWDGEYRTVDDQTFEAGDEGNGHYITYRYAIDGDQLTIDMIRDDCPDCSSAADLAGERIAQTVIYETSPFRRQD
jgi:hypothetical protein